MWDGLHAEAPLTLLRVLCGVWFAPHALGKARNLARASETFEKAGFRPGRWFVLLTICLEVLAGAGLAVGIQPRLAATLAVLVLLGAAYAVVRINGWNWRWQKQGPEYMLFWAAACVLAVSG
jgi:putative oxidoreductase